ncbi:MAG TPA: ATP-binding protein [Thermoanaerobaculaceae bacterium]|nr:ATP-binding protein [Thermoanaerobaculaceae bacterium]
MAEPVRLRLVLPPVARAELIAGDAVDDLGRRIAFPRDTLAEVKLAVVEACLNALEYGAGEVEVELTAHGEDSQPWIEVVVVDHGPGFDPSGVQRPVLEAKLHAQRKRGWGLELIRRLMDDVTISSHPGLTRVRMTRRMGGG